ncbi:DinB family protein [Lacibacter sp. MH-610]|uniref:DinB family protein n=1 Tax=Lacibacter sp. MH-610 TaxID=3020883 RepID=UPI003891B11B
MEKIKKEFIRDCVRHLNEYTKRVKICLDMLSEEQVWQKPNEASNSIANLMLHLCGNMTQYVLSSLGSRADLRERDKEFSAKGGFTKEQLFEKLSGVVHSVIEEIQIHDEESLLKTRTVQGFEKSGIAIILHITEHYSYHTGQIALLTKLMTNEDLEFYKGMDLNAKNRV